MTEGSLTELIFQRWRPVLEAAGRPEARPRQRCCSEFNHLGHVGRSLVGVHDVHQQGTVCTQFLILSATCVSASGLE